MRVCRFTPVSKKKWKMIFKIFKSVMKKWRPCISSILKNSIIISRSWKKKDKRITPIMKISKRNNVFSIPNWEICVRNTTGPISLSKNKTSLSLLNTKESPVNSSNSKESSSTFKRQILKGTTKFKPWTRNKCKNSSKR